MVKKTLSDLRRDIATLGIKSEGKYGITFKVYCLVLPFLTFNSIFIFIYEWDDINKRMAGLKGFVMYLGCLEYLSVVIFNYNEVMHLLDILEEGRCKISYKLSPRRLELQNRIQNEMNLLISAWSLIQNLITICMPLPSIIVLILQIWKTDFQSISIDKLSLPVAFYFPTEWSTFPTFIIALAMQCFYFQQAMRLIIIVVLSPCIAMQQIDGELKLLRLSLEELDSVATQNIRQDSGNMRLDAQDSTNEFNYMTMLTTFIKHQQCIYSCTDKVTKSIQMAAFYVETGLHMVLSVSIYTVAKTDEVIVKLQESLLVFVVMYCLYCYNMAGENVTIEDENLREAVCQTKWYDKPLWYKKRLLCIITRMNKTAEIKRCGIFSLNLHNFAVTVRAGYSIFNILTNF